MTRFGSCSMGLLGLGRWKLWISSWKVTVDGDRSLYIPSTLLSSFTLQGWRDGEAVIDPLLKRAWQCWVSLQSSNFPLEETEQQQTEKSTFCMKMSTLTFVVHFVRLCTYMIPNVSSNVPTQSNPQVTQGISAHR